MIDHMTLTVRDLAATKAFLLKALEPLGYRVHREFPNLVGLGDTKPWLWLKSGDVPTPPMHIAFVARSRALVDGFHQAALAAGARDDGAPGLRAHYHPNYYGAFVIDPLNGHPVEAVCHYSLEVPVVKITAKPAKATPAKPKPKPKAKATKRRRYRRA